MRNGNPERGVPVFSRRGEGDGEADGRGQEIVPEFRGRHLPQAGLRPPVVVIVDVVGDLRGPAAEGLTSPKAHLVLRGTPFIYQGDEIGMVNGHFNYRGIETLNAFPILREKGLSEKETWDAVASTSRDNARIPMRWEDKPGYGFTSATPWLDGGPDRYCVASEQDDPDSILSFYKTAIKLRKSEKCKEAIKEGNLNWFCPTTGMRIAKSARLRSGYTGRNNLTASLQSDCQEAKADLSASWLFSPL